MKSKTIGLLAGLTIVCIALATFINREPSPSIQQSGKLLFPDMMSKVNDVNEVVIETHEHTITLERGVTHDPEFEKWANKVWNFGSGLGAEVSLADFRKDIIIETYNEAGQLALAYRVFRCWVSEFQAMPEMDASASAVAIQTIKLENEGWERDYDVTEPTEPSFTEPAG